MAITATSLETTGSDLNQTSYSSSSISPGANKLILAWVYSIAATTPNTPTATGNGLTWVEVGNKLDSDSVRKITLFRAMGSSPSTGSITFDYSGQTQTGAAWSIVEYDNINTIGINGSGAIVQSVSNSSSGVATNLTITLSSFSSINNATVGGFGIPLNKASKPTAGSGFTQTGQRNQSNPNLSIGSEFLVGNDTTVDMSCSPDSVPWVGIAVEIAAQSVNNSGFFNLI